MATFHKGHGGKVKVGSTDLPTIEWTLTKRNRLAETTHSGSGGVATYLKAVTEVSGTATILYDSTATPESLSLDNGDTVALELYEGDSGQKHIISAAIIEELTHGPINSQNGVCQASFTFKGNVIPSDPS